MMRWILPHPLMSVVLLVCWLWLHNTVAPGHLVLGALLGVGIPLFTRRFWPEPQPVRRPVRFIEFLAVLLFDIVVANLQVALVILVPKRGVRSGFVSVPLEVRGDFAITVLASTISLTPGTVSVELSSDRRMLYLHYLREDDPQALAMKVKQRYERRIREIFE